jgi:hypothetical protein
MVTDLYELVVRRRKFNMQPVKNFASDTDHQRFEDGCLLGCSALMIEAVHTSETLVNSYQSTRRYNTENSYLHSHRPENLKSHKRFTTYHVTRLLDHFLSQTNLIYTLTLFLSDPCSVTTGVDRSYSPPVRPRL